MTFEVLDATRYYFGQTGRRITFEYSLVGGVNDTGEDAKGALGACRRYQLPCESVPVNPIKERSYVQSNHAVIQAFKINLKKTE